MASGAATVGRTMVVGDGSRGDVSLFAGWSAPARSRRPGGRASQRPRPRLPRCAVGSTRPRWWTGSTWPRACSRGTIHTIVLRGTVGLAATGALLSAWLSRPARPTAARVTRTSDATPREARRPDRDVAAGDHAGLPACLFWSTRRVRPADRRPAPVRYQVSCTTREERLASAMEADQRAALLTLQNPVLLPPRLDRCCRRNRRAGDPRDS
jgi:hypothetical protein